MPKLNWMQRHDAARRASSHLVDQACELAGLVPPIPGLGLAITEAAERVFRAIFYGTEDALVPPGEWFYRSGGSSAQLLAIYRALDPDAIAYASQRFGQSVAA